MAPTRAGFEFDSTTYHPRSATHRFEYDPVGTPPCMAVVYALAAVQDVDPTTMPPIEDTVDTDSLDGLVRGFDPGNGAVEVSWTQDGFAVTVSSEGAVTVSPTGSDTRRPSVEG